MTRLTRRNGIYREQSLAGEWMWLSTRSYVGAGQGESRSLHWIQKVAPDHWGKSAPRVVKSHWSVGSLTMGTAVLEKRANSPTCVSCVGVTTLSTVALAPLLDHHRQ